MKMKILTIEEIQKIESFIKAHHIGIDERGSIEKPDDWCPWIVEFDGSEDLKNKLINAFEKNECSPFINDVRILYKVIINRKF